MSKEQTDDTAYKRGYRQGVQDALKTIEPKTIEIPELRFGIGRV